MNFSYLEEGEVYTPIDQTFHDKLNHIKYFRLTATDSDKPPVDCNIHQMIGDYKKAVDKLIEVQHKVDLLEKEIGAFSALAEKLGEKGYTEKLKEIIDEFKEDAGLEELKMEYTETWADVSKYQGAFALCKEADIDNKYVCFVCVERSINVFIDPCGHTMCDECSKKISNKCPMCRATINKKCTLFMSS